MEKGKIAWVATAGILFLLAMLAEMANISPTIGCTIEQSFKSIHYQVRAMRVEVKPWRGPHHVYGVFSVPLQYRQHRLYTTRLRIEGFIGEFAETSPEAGRLYESEAEPGYYIMRVNFPTRMALWYLLTGRFGDLATSCHWWLIIEDRMP